MPERAWGFDSPRPHREKTKQMSTSSSDQPSPDAVAASPLDDGRGGARGEIATLLSSAPFGLLAVDQHHRLTHANEKACLLLGLLPDQISGHALVDSLADLGDSPLLDEALRQASEGETIRRSFQVRAAGVLRGLDLQCWRHEVTGNAEPHVLVMVDASTAQDQVRQISSLIARSPQGMARLANYTAMTNVNDRWTEITGQEISDASGRGWLEMVADDAREDFIAALTMAGEQPRGLKGRLRLVTTEGDDRWIDLSVAPLDQPGHALLTFEDSTEEFDNARRADELSRALEATTDLVAILSADGRVLRWMNEALSNLLSPAALDRDFTTCLDVGSAELFTHSGLTSVAEHGDWRGELNLLNGDGLVVPVSATFVPHIDAKGEVDAISLIARDISELRSAQARATETELRMAALVQNAADLLVLISREGTVLYASPAVDRFLEHGPGSLGGADVLELVHPEDLQAAYDLATEVLDSDATSDHEETPPWAKLRIAHADGSYRTLEVTANDLTDNPAVRGIVVNATDITQRIEVTEKLETLSFHDDLTGLPNRTLLIDKMSEALRRARERRMLVGLLSLDLDRFNVVNESLGHQAGDELLNEVASRINSVIRPGDIVARLGGDEFAVVITDMLRGNDAVNAARRLRKALTEPIFIGEQSAVITTSIGIAIADGDESPEDLLRDADTALHRAKAKGRDLAVVFDDHLRDQAVRRLDVENKLREAIANDALVVHYQPVLDVKTGRLSGSEALVRIRNEDGSLVMPGAFIDVAEDSGLISQLGHQVLVKAIHQTALWNQHKTPGQQPLSIAVNVSARQLTDPQYPEKLNHQLEIAGLEPSQLSLELTESALIDGNPTTERSLQELRTLGVRIGLDDFGTGFSSLAYLKRFPISFLKIDRSFVDGLGTEEDDSAIVRATIALAHGLNLTVVAEGVETEEQFAHLVDLNCDLVQGFLFAKPVDSREFIKFLGMRWSS